MKTMYPIKKKRLSDGSKDFKKGTSSMSEKQRSLMLDFLAEHPSMVIDRSVGGTSHKPSRDELWEKLAAILNTCGSGAQKDGCGWRRSWHDLKRYESLKAKESMVKLGEATELIQEKQGVVLSPLQERIANLISSSISDVSNWVDPKVSKETSQMFSQPCDERQESITLSEEEICEAEGNIPGSVQGEKGTAKEMNTAKALQNIANALTERNAIEERKLRVLENFLTVFAAQNGIAITDAPNLDRGQN